MFSNPFLQLSKAFGRSLLNTATREEGRSLLGIELGTTTQTGYQFLYGANAEANRFNFPHRRHLKWAKPDPAKTYKLFRIGFLIHANTPKEVDIGGWTLNHTPVQTGVATFQGDYQIATTLKLPGTASGQASNSRSYQIFDIDQSQEYSNLPYDSSHFMFVSFESAGSVDFSYDIVPFVVIKEVGSGGGSGSFTLSASDANYYYYGGTINGNWTINRFTKTALVKSVANMTNNSGVTTLSAAWENRSSLVYS